MEFDSLPAHAFLSCTQGSKVRSGVRDDVVIEQKHDSSRLDTVQDHDPHDVKTSIKDMCSIRDTIVT